MQTFRLGEMTKGWFVGQFHPTAFATDACEVAVKRYKAGDAEPLHEHRIATELTAIISGRVRMCGREFGADDIIMLSPGTATDFLALEDTVTVVFKSPCAPSDKYLIPTAGPLV